MKKNAGLSVYLLSLFGVGLFGIGIYFMFFRPERLAEDIGYMGLTEAQSEMLRSFASPWLQNVFRVLGGFVATSGILFFLILLSISTI